MEAVSWHASSIIHCSNIYNEMTEFFENPMFAKLCILSVTSGDLDEFATSLVSILVSNDMMLPIFQSLLAENSAVCGKTSSVDTQTAITKLSTAYARMIGSEYLQALLCDFVFEIVINEDLDFELQKNKLTEDMYTEDDPRVLQQVETNQKALTKALETLVNRVQDSKIIEYIPEEFKLLIQYSHPGNRTEFSTNFLVTKLISPAIVAPDAFNLLPPDVEPSRKARRNLVLLTNLFRKCGSGKVYGKANYMACLNPLITKTHPTLLSVAESIISLPHTLPKHDSVSNSSKNIFSYDFASLLDLHLLLYQFKDNILQQLENTTYISDDVKEKAIDFLDKLVAAPFVAAAEKKIPPWRSRQRSLSYDPTEIIIDSTPDEPEDIINAETANLDKAGFFFLGPNSRDGYFVLYLIVNRFNVEFLYNVDLLITYVYQMISHIGDSKYILVIDMSWTRISELMKRLLYKQAGQLFSVLDHRFRKNLVKAFIVHPSAYTRAVTKFVRQFTSSKLKSKITEIYNWESLQSDINKEDIALPETSKDFITKTYQVTKVNSKGKSQKRLIKFTMDSLLNIDPRTKRVQNEKKISDFAEIIVSRTTPELQIHFNEETTSSRRFKSKGTATDRLHRRYVFDSFADRDDVLLALFRTGFYMPSINYPQEFRVVKVNKRGRHQDRVLKLTCDSLLNLDNTSIKSEISFAGIDSIAEDESKSNVVWLQFKSESKRRKLISKDSQLLVRALQEGLERYQPSEEFEYESMYDDDEKSCK